MDLDALTPQAEPTNTIPAEVLYAGVNGPAQESPMAKDSPAMKALLHQAQGAEILTGHAASDASDMQLFEKVKGHFQNGSSPIKFKTTAGLADPLLVPEVRTLGVGEQAQLFDADALPKPLWDPYSAGGRHVDPEPSPGGGIDPTDRIPAHIPGQRVLVCDLWNSAPWAVELGHTRPNNEMQARAWGTELEERVGNNERFRQFREAVARWTGSSGGIREAAAHLLVGEVPLVETTLSENADRIDWTRVEQATALLDALAAAPPVAPELFRGVALGDVTLEELKAQFATGQEIRLLPQSFSTDRKIARNFTSCWSEGVASVTLRCAPGSTALHIAPAPPCHFWREREWIGAGRFVVTGFSLDTESHGVGTRVTVDIHQVGDVRSLAVADQAPLTVKDL